MKIFHNIYDELISFENVYAAWRSFRSGKSNKECVLEFEHNLEDNLFALHNELADGTYCHGAYERFIVRDPKTRIIHKATVRDRVIHTLVARRLEALYQQSFIAHSFSCQTGRGTHAAVQAVTVMCRRQSRNYARNFWYLKCDIKKFFDTIDHDILLHILRKKIKDEKFMWLIKSIVESFHAGQPKAGLPLGNFTSQWLGNIYLNELDYFVKHHLHQYSYVRYADDFLILSQSREDLLRVLKEVKDYVSHVLKLNLHPDKIMLRKFGSGIEWLGFTILPHYIILKKQTKNRMMVKLETLRSAVEQGTTSLQAYHETVLSDIGQLRHCSGYKISNHLLFNYISYDHAGKIF